MNEVQRISRKLAELPPGETAVLATVVDVDGSSYRSVGARMLILESGASVGTVSGGCLEADVIERARKVRRTGNAAVFTYDTARDENSIFSLSMGCRGVIKILLEPIGNPCVLLKTIELARQFRVPHVVATLVSVPDSTTGANVGGRIFYNRVNEFYFQNLPASLKDSVELKNEISAALNENQTVGVRAFAAESGSFEFCFEIIEPPVSLAVFGAGADAVPLVELAAGLGWHTTVIDHRPAYLTKDRFAKAAALILSDSAELPPDIVLDGQTAAVIMTHNYERDRQILSNLLGSKVSYIGALGPKRRTENLLRELGEAGECVCRSQIAKLFAPVGLDVGADSPETIALSIIAEIQAVLSDRAGGSLRDRKGSINNRDAVLQTENKFDSAGGGKFEQVAGQIEAAT